MHPHAALAMSLDSRSDSEPSSIWATNGSGTDTTAGEDPSTDESLDDDDWVIGTAPQPSHDEESSDEEDEPPLIDDSSDEEDNPKDVPDDDSSDEEEIQYGSLDVTEDKEIPQPEERSPRRRDRRKR